MSRLTFLTLILAWCAVLAAIEPVLGQPAPAAANPDQKAAEPAAEKPVADSSAADEAKCAEKRQADEYYELYKVFADTLDQIERNYVKDINRRDLIKAAIEGMLSKLDPYSNFIAPEEMAEFKTSVESQFGGIGIQVSIENGHLKVISPLVGSPAYRAGLHAGDVISHISGKSAEGITIDQAVRSLKGEPGTDVTITVRRTDKPEPFEVTLTREVVQVETVMGDRRNDDDSWNFYLDDQQQIGYIRLTSFSRETSRQVEVALQGLTQKGLKGLILDLRFNPGGLLNSAIEISDLFVKDGVIVSTEGRNSPKRVWEAREPGTYGSFPMVVLVNRYSASASEIVSACLQDHDRAVIIGERSWGKGSVQNVIDLDEGKSALKLTTAAYRRPSGKNIHRFPDAKEDSEWGVVPSDGFEIKLPEDEMLQLIRARRDRDAAAGLGAPPEKRPVSAEANKFVDRQLQKGLEQVKSKLMAKSE